MSTNAPVAPDEIRVQPWVKWFMYIMSFVPASVGVPTFVRQVSLPHADLSVAIAILLLLTGTSAWLFPRIYRQCSIVVSRDGISQMIRQRGGVRYHKTTVPWENVENVHFKMFSFHFLITNQIELELNTAFFNDAQATIAAVDVLLPHRLREQLNNHGA